MRSSGFECFITPFEMSDILSEIHSYQTLYVVKSINGRDYYDVKEPLLTIIGDSTLADFGVGVKKVDCNDMNERRSNPYQEGMILIGAPYAGMDTIRSIQLAILIKEDNLENQKLFKSIVSKIKKISTRGKKLFRVSFGQVETYYWASEGAVQHCRKGYSLRVRIGSKLKEMPSSDYSVIDD